MAKKRYYELDALRGLAALYVMFFHYSKDNQPVWFLGLGVTGVDLFFIISGFVIFMSINNVSTGKEFVISRVSRLYPTYWTCLTFAFSAMILLKLFNLKVNYREVGIIDYISNLTMFQYYLNVPNLDGPYWTLLIEMLFYVLILILFQLKLLRYITEVGLFILLIALFNFFVTKSNSTYFPLLNHFPLFFAGIMFYRIVTNVQNRLIGYMVIAFCYILRISLFSVSELDQNFITFNEYAVVLLVYFLIFVLFVNNRLGLIVSKPTIFLGRISFALYLIHSFFFRGLLGYSIKHFHINFWVATIFIATIVVWVSSLINKHIEEPFGKRLKTYLNKRVSLPLIGKA